MRMGGCEVDTAYLCGEARRSGHGGRGGMRTGGGVAVEVAFSFLKQR